MTYGIPVVTEASPPEQPGGRVCRTSPFALPVVVDVTTFHLAGDDAFLERQPGQDTQAAEAVAGLQEARTLCELPRTQCRDPTFSLMC